MVTKALNTLGPYEVLNQYDPTLGEFKPNPPLPAALKQQIRNDRKRLRELNANGHVSSKVINDNNNDSNVGNNY